MIFFVFHFERLCLDALRDCSEWMRGSKIGCQGCIESVVTSKIYHWIILNTSLYTFSKSLEGVLLMKSIGEVYMFHCIHPSFSTGGGITFEQYFDAGSLRWWEIFRCSYLGSGLLNWLKSQFFDNKVPL